MTDRWPDEEDVLLFFPPASRFAFRYSFYWFEIAIRILWFSLPVHLSTFCFLCATHTNTSRRRRRSRRSLHMKNLLKLLQNENNIAFCRVLVDKSLVARSLPHLPVRERTLGCKIMTVNDWARTRKVMDWKGRERKVIAEWTKKLM